jgi:hypothetical protein
MFVGTFSFDNAALDLNEESPDHLVEEWFFFAIKKPF